MIVIIDGTGPDNDQEYAREMGNSFPSRIARQVVGSTRACSLAAADWMNGQLKANGVAATLKA